MRIEVLVVSGAGPVYDGVLRLGDVTVLTGRNDSGKTRVLRSIETALMTGPDAEYLEVLGVAAQSELDAFLSDPALPLTGIVAGETATVEPFRAAVEMPPSRLGMRLGLLVSPWIEELLHGWRYGRALIDLDADTRAELADALEDEFLSRKDPDEPLKLEALGGFDPQILPEAIVVPCSATELDLRIVGAIIRLTRALRALASVWVQVTDVAGPLLGGAPEWATTRGPSGETSEVEPSWEWLLLEDEATNISHVHPAAGQACAALQRIVTRLLPGFISDEYRLRIIPGRPTEIARNRPIRIQLCRRSDGEPDAPEDEGEWFDLTDTASGFTVWIQLAFCEAVQRVRRFSYLLQQHVLAVHLIIDQGHDNIRDVTYSSEEIIDGIPPEEDTSERDERVAHRLDGLGVEEHKAALEDLLTGLQDPLLVLPIVPEHPIFQPRPDREFYPDEDLGEALEPIPRGRLYLLDEPEQRLHPMLQRRAAQWLGTLMSQWGAQCVITTHSVAFMAVPGDTFSYEIVRTQDVAKLLPLDIDSLTPYSQIAQEMGLDRGELLSATRAFLITSSPVTALLQELCAEQLTDARITIIPIDDSRHATQSIALLTRLTAAPFGVLLTTITPSEIEQLRHANALQRTRASRGSSETSTAAALIDLSVRHGREIEIQTLNVASVLDLLDERTVARTATGVEPFTGHTAAHDLHLVTDQTYSQFVANTYGITIGQDVVRRLAQSMRDAGIPPPDALTDAIWRIEQLALASEARHRRRE